MEFSEYERDLALEGSGNLPEGWTPSNSDGPALMPGAWGAWEAWEALEWSRPGGMGVGAIPVSEVLAYCTLLGIVDLDYRAWLLRAIQRLDGEFMRHVAEKQKRDNPKE